MKRRIFGLAPALLAILAVTLTVAPAFAGHRYVARRAVPRPVVRVPYSIPPRVIYRPPVYVGPRYIPAPYWRQPVYVQPPAYWVPGGYRYDQPSLGIGVYRGGLGLHVEF